MVWNAPQLLVLLFLSLFLSSSKQSVVGQSSSSTTTTTTTLRVSSTTLHKQQQIDNNNPYNNVLQQQDNNNNETSSRLLQDSNNPLSLSPSAAPVINLTTTVQAIAANADIADATRDALVAALRALNLIIMGQEEQQTDAGSVIIRVNVTTLVPDEAAANGVIQQITDALNTFTIPPTGPPSETQPPAEGTTDPPSPAPGLNLTTTVRLAVGSGIPVEGTLGLLIVELQNLGLTVLDSSAVPVPDPPDTVLLSVNVTTIVADQAEADARVQQISNILQMVADNAAALAQTDPPSGQPTGAGSEAPSETPSGAPSQTPSTAPSAQPTTGPSAVPLSPPPTSLAPSGSPMASVAPPKDPGTEFPSTAPSVGSVPSTNPSFDPTAPPSGSPMASVAPPKDFGTEFPSTAPSVGPSGPVCPNPSPDIACPAVFDAVTCGSNECSYSNPCTAEAAGFVTSNDCTSTTPSSAPSAPVPAPVCPNPSPDIACPAVFDPVTCGPNKCSYSSPCSAGAAGFTTSTDCTSTSPSIPPSAAPSITPSNTPTRVCPFPATGSVCPAVFEPVVCGPNECRYVNSCLAEAAGFPRCTSSRPSAAPSTGPSTSAPSGSPSAAGSSTPSAGPSQSPSSKQSGLPSFVPSGGPSTKPSTSPSAGSSTAPSTSEPSETPSITQSRTPSVAGSVTPSAEPSQSPSAKQSGTPSFVPSGSPSAGPSTAPSPGPSLSPSPKPSVTPSIKQSGIPSFVPSVSPSAAPSTSAPSLSPTAVPSSFPTSQPTEMMVSPVEGPAVLMTFQCRDADQEPFWVGAPVNARRDCAWLRENASLQQILCQPSGSAAFYLCPLTCQRCQGG